MRQPCGRRPGKPGKVPAGLRRSSARRCRKGRRRDGAGSDPTAPYLHVARTSRPHTRPACLIAGGCRTPSRWVARIADCEITRSSWDRQLGHCVHLCCRIEIRRRVGAGPEAVDCGGHVRWRGRPCPAFLAWQVAAVYPPRRMPTEDWAICRPEDVGCCSGVAGN